ncbi:MAG: hypothetical protein ACJA0E_001802 [Bermanella sp.]|jgi:hypothetical protein
MKTIYPEHTLMVGRFSGTEWVLINLKNNESYEDIIEGSSSGIVPWAQLAGYATEESILVRAACSRVTVKDFFLSCR